VEPEALVAAALERVRPVAAARPGSWRREAATTLLPPLLAGREAAFLEWARHDLRWSLTAAERAAEVCAKPREAAVDLLAAICAEALEEEAP